MKTDLETLRLGDEERPEPERLAVPKARQMGVKAPVLRRAMSADEALAVTCIRMQVTFPVAHWDKRFMRELPDEITEKQAAQVWRIFKTYRRQIQHERKAELLALAGRLGAPNLRQGDLEKGRGGEGKP